MELDGENPSKFLYQFDQFQDGTALSKQVLARTVLLRLDTSALSLPSVLKLHRYPNPSANFPPIRYPS
jgi:hypothetical protein